MKAEALQRTWHRTALVALCAVLLAASSAFLLCLMPAPAVGKAGQLDRSFSKDGRVLTALPFEEDPGYADYRLPFEFLPGAVAMALAPDGKIVVASSRDIVQYLPSGRPDREFGGNGRIAIGHGDGFRFQLADVSVDSMGRILVAGTTKPQPPRSMLLPQIAGPAFSSATVRRYQADGQPDPSFDGDGVLTSDLGAEPPSYRGQRFEAAAVAILGLAVDAADRPILTGSMVIEVGRCSYGGFRYNAAQAFVGRLTESGALDSGFAASGMKPIGGLSWLQAPTSTSAGGTVSVGTRASPCGRGFEIYPDVLVALGEDGTANQEFGASGFWAWNFGSANDAFVISAVSVTPSGRILLFGVKSAIFEDSGEKPKERLMRLLPDGRFDPRFGRRGRLTLSLPKRTAVAAIAADARERVLLAGGVPVRQTVTPRLPRSRFFLMRRTASGKRDFRFGRKGRVITAFGRGTRSTATDVLVDSRGRILVGGKFAGRGRVTPSGFALARYLSR